MARIQTVTRKNGKVFYLAYIPAEAMMLSKITPQDVLHISARNGCIVLAKA